jgi:hypothetical protein
MNMEPMSDERLEEIREAVAKQRRFMEWNCRGIYITKTHSVTHIEELIAEVERLKADAARLDWIDRSSVILCQRAGDGPVRNDIDELAGKEATWLTK